MPEEIAITLDETETKGRYVAVVNSHEAEMTYSRTGEAAVIIDHTAVPDALRARGVGRALVRRAFEDARAKGRTIFPLCPFARVQMARHPEWQDVLAS